MATGVNKTKEVHKFEKRLRKLQRSVFRKYEMDKEETVTSKHATV